MNTIIIILIFYAVISVVTSIALAFYDCFNDGVITRILPQDLHYYTNMNWVGCIVVSILLFILLPLVWLYRLFYILFHIGT